MPPIDTWQSLKIIFEWAWVLVKVFAITLWPAGWIIIGIMFLIALFVNRLLPDFLAKFRIRGNNDYDQDKAYIDENGYKRFSDSGILVHRWVAEKKLGRKLRKDEVVHHKNRNKLDNSPSNLWVFSNQDEHDEVHKKDGDFNNDDDYDY